MISTSQAQVGRTFLQLSSFFSLDSVVHTASWAGAKSRELFILQLTIEENMLADPLSLVHRPGSRPGSRSRYLLRLALQVRQPRTARTAVRQPRFISIGCDYLYRVCQNKKQPIPRNLGSFLSVAYIRNLVKHRLLVHSSFAVSIVFIFLSD